MPFININYILHLTWIQGTNHINLTLKNIYLGYSVMSTHASIECNTIHAIQSRIDNDVTMTQTLTLTLTLLTFAPSV